MTVTEVREWVKEIRQVATETNGRPAAHALEDELYLVTLRAIAAGACDPAKLAAEALESSAVAFDRRYQ